MLYNGTFDIPTYKYQLLQKKWPTQSLYKIVIVLSKALGQHWFMTDRHTFINADLLEPELHRWSKIPTTFFLCIRPFGTF